MKNSTKEKWKKKKTHQKESGKAEINNSYRDQQKEVEQPHLTKWELEQEEKASWFFNWGLGEFMYNN